MADSTTMFQGIPKFGHARMLQYARIAREARVPFLMWGDPGIGKSSLVDYVRKDITGQYVSVPSERMKARQENRLEPIETIIGSIADPTDILGFPEGAGSDENRHIKFIPREWARKLLSAKTGVLFLDELTSCPPSVQNALLKLVLDGVAGDVKLPDDVYIIAAANPPTQMAVGYELTPPMSNRLAHVIFDPNQPGPHDLMGHGTDTWIKGMSSGWDSVYADVPVPVRLSDDDIFKLRGLVFGYLKSTPGAMSDNTLITSASDMPLAFATPRSWDSVVRMLSYVDPNSMTDSLDGEMKTSVISSLIGQHGASGLIKYMQDVDLPSPTDVLRAAGQSPQAVDKLIKHWDRSPTVWAITLSVMALFESNITAHYENVQSFLDILADKNHVEIGLSQMPRMVSSEVISELVAHGINWKFDKRNSAYIRKATELKKEIAK